MKEMALPAELLESFHTPLHSGVCLNAGASVRGGFRDCRTGNEPLRDDGEAVPVEQPAAGSGAVQLYGQPGPKSSDAIPQGNGRR